MNTDYQKPSVEKVKEEREREYPNEEITETQPSLHIHGTDEDAGWIVWLNPDSTPDTGLCVGFGGTRDEAVADAVKALEWAVAKLQQPGPLSGT